MNRPFSARGNASGLQIERSVLVFCAAAAALLAYLFREAWLHGYVLGQSDILYDYFPWQPQKPPGMRAPNRLLHDVPTQFYPFMHHARAALLSGDFPFWATEIGAGQPFFASFITAVLSPFTLLTCPLPFPASLTVNAAARLFVGGLGAYLFLRALSVGVAGSAFGGLAYLFNPFSVVWLEHPQSAVAAWLPWLLLTSEMCVRRRDAVAIVSLAVVVTLSLLGGHPETAFKMAMLAGAYAVYRGIVARCAVRAATCVLGAMALGLVAAAVQVLPFLEYARESRVLAARGEASGPLFTNPVSSIFSGFVT